MANVAKAFRQYLLDQTAVTDLVGDRIYRGVIEQSATLPAVAIAMGFTRHDQTLNGFAGLAHVRMTVAAYADDPDDAVEVAEAIRTSGIVGVKGVVHGVDIRGARVEDGYREDVEFSQEDSDDHRYVVSFDFEIDYLEAV
jgi:hypothetical protein